MYALLKYHARNRFVQNRTKSVPSASLPQLLSSRQRNQQHSCARSLTSTERSIAGEDGCRGSSTESGAPGEAGCGATCHNDSSAASLADTVADRARDGSVGHDEERGGCGGEC
jgi:hypothetical protein